MRTCSKEAFGKGWMSLELAGGEVIRRRGAYGLRGLRPKSVDQSEDWHEYDVEPERIKQGKGGVYEFQCSRCSHSFQAKMQPAFGAFEWDKGTTRTTA
eukprot:4313288-Amphidinium_carterae.1